MRKVTKIIILLSGMLFFLLIGFAVWELTSLRRLTIKGSTYYTEESLKKIMIQNRFDENTILLYLKLKYKKIEVPFVDEVDVDLIGMNSIKVRVYEKDIMGAFPYMGEYVCFDKDGTMVGSILNRREDVPVIEGISYKKAIYNEELDAVNSEIFDLILNLTQLIKKYKISIQRIQFDQDLSVRLYSGEVKVNLGKRTHFDEPLSNLPELLEKTKGMKGVLKMENYSSENRRVIFEGEQ